ncbi:MAG: hypothetical protein Q8T13_05110 [Acidobacteriota bacterium]|nr:hypothetical protein [Acidobacteriota bacterium]
MATDTQTQPTQIAKASDVKTPEVITRPDDFTAAIQKWTGNYNLLSPFTQITGMAPQHGIIASVVKINANPAKGGPGEVYDGLPFLGQGEVALAKIGLRKIAEGAGISITTQRTDPRTIPFLWEFKAIATYRGIDGTVVTREATAEWDLREGSPRLNGWKPAQIVEGRKNGLRNAETRAINAAIREFGIKQKYSQQELAKPFLVLRVAWQPNPNDPEQMRMVAENAMRGTSALYGTPALPAAPINDIVDADVVDEQPRTVGSGAASETAKVETPDPNQPPVEGAVRIEEVNEKSGVNDKTKRPWKRFDVVDSNGEVCSTFDTKLAEAAIAARASKAWVELSIEQNGNYRNLVEISPAGQSPRLPDMENT